MQNYHEQANVDAAIKLLTEAVDRDQQYAAAVAALGRTLFLNFSTSKQSSWLDQAGAACRNQRQPESEALGGRSTALAWSKEGRGRYERAIESCSSGGRSMDSPMNEQAALPLVPGQRAGQVGACRRGRSRLPAGD